MTPLHFFILMHLLLAIPAWLSLLIAPVQLPVQLGYLLVWHLPIIFLAIKPLYSRKLVKMLCFFALAAVAVPFVYSLAILGWWAALTNPYSLMALFLAVLQVRHLNMLINFVASGAVEHLREQENA
jgi:hypothetical protein